MDPQRLQTLLHKYGQRQLTDEENAELESWYAALGQDMPAPFTGPDSEHHVQEHIWDQLTVARQPAKTFRIGRWLRAAAIILPLAGIATYFAMRTSPVEQASPQLAETISTPRGAMRRITLPDSTKVTLNAGSEISYKMKENTREVTLRGEAFFDVAPDPQKPFLIQAGRMNIRVLGTAFNVKAYPEDRTAEASLIRGLIEVSLTADPSRKFTLRPNDKIVLPNRQEAAADEPDDLKKLYTQGYALSSVSVSPQNREIVETAWTDNRLYFMNESFADIATELERKYEVRIQLADKATRNLRFTATFENENIRQVLEALQYTSTSPFNYRIENNQIYITR